MFVVIESPRSPHPARPPDRRTGGRRVHELALPDGRPGRRESALLIPVFSTALTNSTFTNIAILQYIGIQNIFVAIEHGMKNPGTCLAARGDVPLLFGPILGLSDVVDADHLVTAQ
jgi:hypothetical protein